MRGFMKRISENLRNTLGLLRDARSDIEEGAGRLDEAEQKVKETLELLDARKENLSPNLDQPPPKNRLVRSKE